MTAKPFASFDDAVRALPRFITGLDLLAQHHTIADLRFLAQHEIDLAVDGEENNITSPKRQSDVASRWRKVRAFIARCDAEAQS